MNVMTGGGSVPSSHGTTRATPAFAAPALATQTTAPAEALAMHVLLQDVVDAQELDAYLQLEQEPRDATEPLLDVIATDFTALPAFAPRDLPQVLSHPLPHMHARVAEPAAKALKNAHVPTVAVGGADEPGAALVLANAAVQQAKEKDAVAPALQAAPPAAVPMQKGEQALVQALAHRIQVQQIQGTDVATVRLDPPQMGSLEIRIRHDLAGAVHVQMQASNAEVGRQLTTLVEGLRQELLQRSADAQVTVASSRSQSGAGAQGDPQQSHPQHQQETAIGQALQAWDGADLT